MSAAGADIEMAAPIAGPGLNQGSFLSLRFALHVYCKISRIRMIGEL